MKFFAKGDRVYVVKPGCLAGVQAPIERVVFDRMEDELAFVTDSPGSHWEIPMGFVCGVPEGHVFAADLGTTSVSIRHAQMMAEAQGSNRPATTRPPVAVTAIQKPGASGACRSLNLRSVDRAKRTFVKQMILEQNP